MKGYTQYPEKITVIVRKEGDGQNETQQQGAKVGGGQIVKNEGKIESLIPKNTQGNGSMYLTNKLFSEAKQAVSYIRQFKGDVNGDQALQDRADREAEILNDTVGTLLNVGMSSFKYGIWGGVIAAGTAAISIGAKYYARQRDYDMRMFKENQNISYMRARAGINLTTGRLR